VAKLDLCNRFFAFWVEQKNQVYVHPSTMTQAFSPPELWFSRWQFVEMKDPCNRQRIFTQCDDAVSAAHEFARSWFLTFLYARVTRHQLQRAPSGRRTRTKWRCMGACSVPPSDEMSPQTRTIEPQTWVVRSRNENLYSPEMVETAENKNLTNFN